MPDELEVLTEFIREKFPSTPRTFACAYSGGTDSTALLILLTRWAERENRKILALHCHHHLRKDSDTEARECERFARECGADFRCLNLDVPSNRQPGEAIEACCRRLRYAAFESTLENFPDPVLFLAHHANDAVENLLIRLMRGCNISGITSPKAVTTLGRLTLARPLLKYRKDELAVIAGNQSVSNDRTNAESHCLRNALRLEVIPGLYQFAPHGRGGIEASLHALREDADCLDILADEAFQQLHQNGKLSRPPFEKLHSALQVRVLQRFLTIHSPCSPTVSVIERLQKSRGLGGRRDIPLTTHWRLRLVPKWLMVIHEKEECRSTHL